MTAEKQKELKEFIYLHLTTLKAYDIHDTLLEKVIFDVIEAQKLFRLNELRKYVNRREKVKIGELTIDVILCDVRVKDGDIEWQVEPIAGGGRTWVNRFI